MEMKLTLSRLTPDDLRKLLEFSRIKKVNLNNLVETQLFAWLRAMEQKFADAGPCPSCRLRGVKSEMKGMPILDAEREGLVEIAPKSDRDLLKRTQYVICPQCLWWGFPEKK
jgi:hypothetical protein